MDILSNDDDSIYTLTLVGSFDTTEVEKFQAFVEGAIDDQNFKIVVNVGQMTFINSTALGSLIRAQKRLNQYGGDLAIEELSGFPASVFKTLGIDRKIKCFDGHAEAIDYLRSVGAEGVGVEGEQQVGFKFLDAEQLGAAGDDVRIGVMKSIGEFGIRFNWENLDDLDVDTMFSIGARLRVGFALPLYHESHTFEADATLESVDAGAGGRVSVQAKFVDLSDIERRAIQQFVRDIRYLKGELS